MDPEAGNIFKCIVIMQGKNGIRFAITATDVILVVLQYLVIKEPVIKIPRPLEGCVDMPLNRVVEYLNQMPVASE